LWSNNSAVKSGFSRDRSGVKGYVDGFAFHDPHFRSGILPSPKHRELGELVDCYMPSTELLSPFVYIPRFVGKP
jgi:hypothetical protein